MTFSKTLTTALIAATACALTPVMAVELDPREKSMEVSIKGYDLDNATDAAEVFRKINSASKHVCRIYGKRETLRDRIYERQCRVDAIVKAVGSIDAPQLTAIMHDEMGS